MPKSPKYKKSELEFEKEVFFRYDPNADIAKIDTLSELEDKNALINDINSKIRIVKRSPTISEISKKIEKKEELITNKGRRKPKRKRTGPARPLNAYMRFAKKERSKVDKNLGVVAIAQEIGKRWRESSKETKDMYRKEADRDMAAHISKYPKEKKKTVKKPILKVLKIIKTPSDKKKMKRSSSKGSKKNMKRSSSKGSNKKASHIKKMRAIAFGSHTDEEEKDYSYQDKKKKRRKTIDTSDEEDEERESGSIKRATKRSLNPYIVFTISKRSNVKQNNPTMSSKEIISKLGELWRGLSDSEKQKYRAK